MACTPSLLVALTLAVAPAHRAAPPAPVAPAASSHVAAETETAHPPFDEGDAKTVGLIAFEGDDQVARTLLYALARVLRHRGHSTGVKAPLSELESTLQCDPRTTPHCLDGSPAALGVDLTIYGSMQRIGDGYRIDLFLAGTTEDVHPHVGIYIPRQKIVGPSVGAVAAALAGQLWPRRPRAEVRRAASPPPPPPPLLRPTPVQYEPPTPPRARRFPRWAAAGLGASTATAAVGWSLILAGRIGVDRARADATLAAARSLEDTSAANDVPLSSVDLCLAGGSSNASGGVRNASVTAACKRGEQAQQARSIGIALALIGSAANLGFGAATLVMTHRKKNKGRRAKVRVDPSPSGAVLRF